MSRIFANTVFPGAEKLLELHLEFFDSVHRNLVEIAILHRPQHGDLCFDRDRVVLDLLEKFDDARATVELRLRLGIQVGAELRKRRQFAELGQIEL